MKFTIIYWRLAFEEIVYPHIIFQKKPTQKIYIFSFNFPVMPLAPIQIISDFFTECFHQEAYSFIRIGRNVVKFFICYHLRNSLFSRQTCVYL